MDLTRIRELGGVDNDRTPAQTVSEVLTENNTPSVTDNTNRLRKMAGLAPITESVAIVEEACECTTDGCKCGGKMCRCGGECGCKNCIAKED